MKLKNNSRDSLVYKTGPTAWVVAYKRTIANIPYAKEIFNELAPSIKVANSDEIDYFEHAKESKNTPQLEARYKLINKILKDQNPSQILEIAAGLSPRGIQMTQRDSNLKYVEIDLPSVMAEKQKIVANLAEKEKINTKNLVLECGNALNYKSMFEATKSFKQKPITVVNEGLLRYMNFDQKSIVAKNVHKLLKKFGGIWITPDITLRKIIMSESKGKEYQRISQLTGIDIDANSFKDVTHAKEFFEEHGFSVKCISLTEIEKELVTPKKIGMGKQEVHETIKNVIIFVMKLK